MFCINLILHSSSKFIILNCLAFIAHRGSCWLAIFYRFPLSFSSLGRHWPFHNSTGFLSSVNAAFTDLLTKIKWLYSSETCTCILTVISVMNSISHFRTFQKAYYTQSDIRCSITSMIVNVVRLNNKYCYTTVLNQSNSTGTFHICIAPCVIVCAFLTDCQSVAILVGILRWLLYSYASRWQMSESVSQSYN